MMNRRAWVVFGIVLVVIAACVRNVYAHDAPSGWTYPAKCCGSRDCIPLAAEAVVEFKFGYWITATGETVEESRATPSPDGRFHACRNLVTGKLTCFFAPVRNS